MAYVAQAAVGYMGEINASAKNDIVKDFRNRNDEMLAKTVKVHTSYMHTRALWEYLFHVSDWYWYCR